MAGKQGDEEVDLEIELEWPDDGRHRPSETGVGDRTTNKGAVADARAAMPVPLLPAITGRIESIDHTLATLSMRIDRLSGATASLRSMISDRLTDYADTMSSLARSQADTIEEYRHGQDRAIAEARRSLTDNDEVLRRLAGRVDELMSLSQALSEYVRTTSASADEGFDSLEGTMQALREELENLELPQSAPLGVAEHEMVDAVHLLRDEVQQLKRRIGLRARAPLSLDAEQLEAIAESVQAKLGQPALDGGELDRLVEAIVHRLDAVIEVVPAVAPPEVTAPKPPPRRAPARAPARAAARGTKAEPRSPRRAK